MQGPDDSETVPSTSSGGETGEDLMASNFDSLSVASNRYEVISFEPWSWTRPSSRSTSAIVVRDAHAVSTARQVEDPLSFELDRPEEHRRAEPDGYKPGKPPAELGARTSSTRMSLSPVS
jgi:hypothetical protein